MNAVSLRRGLSPADMDVLLGWANAGGQDFLKQFAGPKWEYPLTREQVAAEAGDIWSIYAGDAFAGIVQRLAVTDGRARVGRFLIDPARRGEGIGERALKRFCTELFADGAVRAVVLNVYRFNAGALRCYEKCGFRVTGAYGEGTAWEGCGMELRREDDRT